VTTSFTLQSEWEISNESLFLLNLVLKDGFEGTWNVATHTHHLFGSPSGNLAIASLTTLPTTTKLSSEDR
jgi:hypothetical protein